jgi:hypothetical protein
MNRCEEYQDLFVDHLYRELQGTHKQELEEHLKSCTQCAEEYGKFSATLKMMNRRERPEPSAEFWLRFNERLQDRLTDVSRKPSVETARRASSGKIPEWWWKAAAALLLVGFGIIIGRYYSGRSISGPEFVQQKPSIAVPSHQASFDPETRRFLERSEILLVGLVNLDTESEDAYMPELTAQKRISQDLIQEAAVLKTRLKGSDQRRLRRLVSDLELILLQIANLEAKSDLPEIELVKSGVDRKGVLLKINLEQMRMSGTAHSPEQKIGSGKKTL